MDKVVGLLFWVVIGLGVWWLIRNMKILFKILPYVISISLVAIVITIIALWNIPFAQKLFPFIVISEEFPTKIIGGFTAVLAWSTMLLAYVAFLAIEHSNSQEKTNRNELLQRLALERIRLWAEDVFDAVSDPLGRGVTKPNEVKIQERLRLIVRGLRSGEVKSIGILKDAEQIGGSVVTKVKKARRVLLKFIAMSGNDEDITSFRKLFPEKDFGCTLTRIDSLEDSSKGLDEARKEVMVCLTEVISSVTETLVPQK